MDEHTKNLLTVFLIIVAVSVFFLYKKSFVDHSYDTFFSETEELEE